MLKKAFLTNSSGILCSRVFGFLRDLSMANILGAGVYSDIFFVAFKFPNLFRRIFGEGAFTQSFLPSFIASSKKGAFSVLVLGIFSLILIAFSLLVVAFSGVFTRVLALGFSEDLIELAKPIVAIHFWYLLLVFWVTFFSTLLQYKQSFWVSAYNTALLNIAMICALLLARDSDGLMIVYMVSYGVLVGGVAQVCLHIYPLYKLGFLRLFICGVGELRLARQGGLFKGGLFARLLKRPKPESSKTGDTNCALESAPESTMDCALDSKSARLAQKIRAELRAFFRQFLPAMLGSSTAQLASFIDTILASFLATGSISYLYYANRIFQLPLAIFAIAISTALFPMVAKAIKAGEQEKALSSMKRAFWFLLFMLMICSVGGIVLSDQIIWLLYEHGKFSRADTMECALVFAGYMLGLVPFGCARIFSLYLYSHNRQAQAAKISAISLLLGVVFSLIFMQFWGAFGLALAGSLSGVALFVLSVRAFGVGQFWAIMQAKKQALLLALLLLLEVALLLLWRALVQIPGI